MPYTTAATTCVNTVNTLRGSSQCSSELESLSSATTLASSLSAAQAICSTQICRNRLQVYVDFLLDCLVHFDEVQPSLHKVYHAKSFLKVTIPLNLKKMFILQLLYCITSQLSNDAFKICNASRVCLE